MVRIDTAAALPDVSPLFAGFTNDWWTKDDTHDGPKWDTAGMMTLDLQSPALRAAAAARAPALWRIGGTPADTVVYNVGNPPECEADGAPPATCPTTPQVYRKWGCPKNGTKGPGAATREQCLGAKDPHGQPCCWDDAPVMNHESCYIVRTPECLSMGRWREILGFAKDVGLSLVFGLNGLYQRQSESAPLNLTNAVQLLEYTAADPGLRSILYGVELSNELGGKGPATTQVTGGGHVHAAVLAADFVALHSHLVRLWPSPANRPKLFGPDCGVEDNPSGHLSGSWWPVFLRDAGAVLSGITFHTYTYGASDSPDLFEHMLDPRKLDKIATTASASLAAAKDAGLDPTRTPVIAGEMGPSSGGGSNGTTNRFVDSFWYLEALGKQSSLGIHAFARSTLTGGMYEQLDHERDFYPNPDFWAGLAWSKSMGTTPLNVTVLNDGGGTVRAHAHCSRGTAGEISLVLMNIGSADALVSIAGGLKLLTTSHFRSVSGLRSADVEVQVAPSRWQRLATKGGVPALPPPMDVSAGPATVSVAAQTYAFATLGTANACLKSERLKSDDDQPRETDAPIMANDVLYAPPSSCGALPASCLPGQCKEQRKTMAACLAEEAGLLRNRTLPAVLGGLPTVLDFGAQANSSVDDTPSFSFALAHHPTIRVPPGKHSASLGREALSGAVVMQTLDRRHLPNRRHDQLGVQPAAHP